MPRTQKLSRSALLDAIATKGLCLLPFPRQLAIKGSPFTVLPGAYFYVSAQAAESTRKAARLLQAFFKDLRLNLTVFASPQLQPEQAVLSNSATLPRLPALGEVLRGEAKGAGGYHLTIGSDGVALMGSDAEGLQNGLWTLRQLLEDGPQIPGLDIYDWPLVHWRGVHIDCKGWAPTAAYLKKYIATLASFKINAVVLEYEAWFGFPKVPEIAVPGALTAQEVSEIDIVARDHGVSLIPLMQPLGNVGHITSVPRYAPLREHPRYLQMFCPVLPETANFVAAMMDGLMGSHTSKFFHLGGDGVRLLGSHPATAARIAQVKGRHAVYLEYIGKLTKYLIARGREPLLWDDEFRQMTDAQIKWLPPEAVLTVWQFDAQGGRAGPALLETLGRYQKLGRKVWGAALRTPSRRYDAFDNIDSWADAAEKHLIDGILATAWTRDHSFSGLYPPPESAWPATLYAAERAWFGLKGMSRELLPQRFVARMFGLRDTQAQGRMWTGFDLLMRGYARRARPFFVPDDKALTRNIETVAFVESWSAIRAAQEAIAEIDDEVGRNCMRIRAGRGDPLYCGRLRWRVQHIIATLPELLKKFEAQAARVTHESVIREFSEAQVGWSMQRVRELESWLAAYPLPEEQLRPQPDV